MQIQVGFTVDGITMFNFPIAISEYPFAIRMKRHTFRFAPKTESVVLRAIIAWRADAVSHFEIIRFEFTVFHSMISFCSLIFLRQIVPMFLIETQMFQNGLAVMQCPLCLLLPPPGKWPEWIEHFFLMFCFFRRTFSCLWAHSMSSRRSSRVMMIRLVVGMVSPSYAAFFIGRISLTALSLHKSEPQP